MTEKTVKSVLIERSVGLVVFLVVMGLFNLVHFDNRVYQYITSFLNENFWLILLFSIMFFLGEFFIAIDYPLKLAFPLFYSVGAILLIKFMFRILLKIGELTNQSFSINFIEGFLLIVVPLLIGVLSYLKMFADLTLIQESGKHKETFVDSIKRLFNQR